jgi:hypothetical protein
MPDDIRDIVEAGVEIAKEGPKTTMVDKKIQATPLSSNPDEARQAWDAPWE